MKETSPLPRHHAMAHQRPGAWPILSARAFEVICCWQWHRTDHLTGYPQYGNNAVMEGTLKPLHWIASSLDDLRELPEAVKDAFGYALQRVQEGHHPENSKPLKGFSGAGVLEIVESFDGNAYRAVYTVKFALAVYVLHVFQKKSKKGIATPARDLDLIHRRLKAAADDYAEHYRSKKP